MTDKLTKLMEMRGKAAQGDWSVGWHGQHETITGYSVSTRIASGEDTVLDLVSGEIPHRETAGFIVAAHRDLPAIAEYVERLEGALKPFAAMDCELTGSLKEETRFSVKTISFDEKDSLSEFSTTMTDNYVELFRPFAMSDIRKARAALRQGSV